MGANIGSNVKIHKDAKIGQCDLLTIGDNVAIDNCIIRPFSLEEVSCLLVALNLSFSYASSSSLSFSSFLSLSPVHRVISFFFR
jgi:hypothetical protein